MGRHPQKKFVPKKPFKPHKYYDFYPTKNASRIDPILDPAEALKNLAFFTRLQQPIPENIGGWFMEAVLTYLSPKNTKTLDEILGFQKSTKGRTLRKKKQLANQEESVVRALIQFLSEDANVDQAVAEAAKYPHNNVYLGEKSIRST